jgi:hypothetical protein
MLQHAYVIISGQPRYTKNSVRSLRDHMIKPLLDNGFNPVVISCTWRVNSYDKFAPSELEEPKDSVIDFFRKQITPEIMHFEDNIDFFATRDSNRINIPLAEAPSYESQYYCLQKASKLMRRHVNKTGKNPSIVIKTRADLIYRKPIPSMSIMEAVSKCMIPATEGWGWSGDLPPKPWIKKKKWLPDQLWMGPECQMERMMSFYKKWHLGYTRFGKNIEQMLWMHSQAEGINWTPFRCPIKIERTINNK